MPEKFHSELNHLKEEVLELANLARNMLHKGSDALIRQDTGLAETVDSQKGMLREKCVELEERAYRMIAMYQPMAKDMRVIACSLKIIEGSERVGRYGKDIANITKKITDPPEIAYTMSIPHMEELVIEMIDDLLQAYKTGSIHFINEFSARDDAVDALWHSIFREGITHMMEDPKKITTCTYYIMVARYLERCADHACRMAENVHYMQKGERIEIK
jgi:phosphate transport system protein